MNDKVEIFGSPLGMYSLLRGDFIISVLNDDGTLNEGRLNSMCCDIANMGANALRDFFWIDTGEAYEKISPFWQEGRKKFRFNDQYYDNQEKIARVCNDYGMRYYICLFDHCGTEKETGKRNPWHFFNDYFYEDDAADMRHKHIDRVLDKLNGTDFGVEVCNEPKIGQGAFLAETLIYLVKTKKFDPKRIILGNDYFLKEKNAAYGRDYREFREKVDKALPGDWALKVKTECISPFHNAHMENIKHLYGNKVKPGGQRRILYSMDGVRKFEADGQTIRTRPDKKYMHKIAKKVLETKTKAREEDKILFEVVYGKEGDEPMDSIEGVSEAYKEIFGKYPENYKKYQCEGGGNGKEYRVYVLHGYRAILGREADSRGLQDYMEYLEGGGNILDFCRKLIDSPEFRDKSANLPPSDLAHRLYRGILNREPDPGGLPHTIEMIQQGRIAERAAAMLESPEFKNKFAR